jgi:carbon-monoxide dehydrogenase medium subunit
MLNLRLAQPPLLVDITRIPELAAVSEEADAVTIGATVTHAAIEDGRVPDPTGGFLSRVARGIGYRAVRTRGTIGGSLAHADPSADWLACLTALRAEVVIAASGGRRRVALARFVRGAMNAALGASELLAAVRVPRLPREARFGFHKICRKTGEFAEAIGVVVAIPEQAYLTIAVGPASGRPRLMEARKVDWSRAAMTLDEAKSILTAADKLGYRAGDDDYARTLHAVALKRAYDEAVAA